MDHGTPLCSHRYRDVYMAWRKESETKIFRFGDLFTTILRPHKVGYETKQQLFIEGILGIVLGLILFTVF